MRVGWKRIDEGRGRPGIGRRVPLRGAAILVLALGTAGCGAVQNMMPDPASFKLPDRTSFFPTNTTAFANTVLSSGPVGPGDLVDGQGLCAGAANGAPGGIALEMTECQVVRTLGQPQSVEINPQPGMRRATLTYTGVERGGIYQFTGGRLTSVERGNEPLPAPVAKKPAAKKPNPPA
jgi:hypothetical protein